MLGDAIMSTLSSLLLVHHAIGASTGAPEDVANVLGLAACALAALAHLAREPHQALLASPLQPQFRAL